MPQHFARINSYSCKQPIGKCMSIMNATCLPKMKKKNKNKTAREQHYFPDQTVLKKTKKKVQRSKDIED